MADSDEILQKLNNIDNKLANHTRWLWIKDILIPLAGVLLAVMGFLANSDANKRQKEEAAAARDQKYLEYFLANYSDSSPTKQAAAFSLLKYIDPKVQKDLVFGLSSNTNLSREAWNVIVSLNDVRLNFGAANLYRIEIYYHKEKEKAAKRIKDQLLTSGFEGEIELGEKIAAFWDRYGWGDGNEMRYDPHTDNFAMKYLFRFIYAKNPELSFKENAVDDQSRPKTIAIHLPPNINRR